MDGLVQVLVLSLFTALAKGDGCSMVQDFDADVVFNQSSEPPSPLNQVHAKNSKICNSKCCALDGCNVAYFDSSKSGKSSCVMYSCHPTSACGFVYQPGVQIFVNEVDLPAISDESIALSVSNTVERNLETAPMPTSKRMGNEAPLPLVQTNATTTNTPQSSPQISKSNTTASNDMTLESHKIDANETTNNTSNSPTHISSSLTTAPSNETTSESSETDADAVSNITVSQTSLHMITPTPMAEKNDTSASHIAANTSDSFFRPSSSSAFANQILPTQTLSPYLSEDFSHSISIPNLENSSYTTKGTVVQPNRTSGHIATEMVSLTLQSSDESSTHTSQNATALLSSPVSTLSSTTTTPNSNHTDSHSPILNTSTVMLSSPKDSITSSYGSGDRIEPTSLLSHQVTSEIQAIDLMGVTSTSLHGGFDISKYTGDIVTTERPVIVPTESENVMGSSSAAIDGSLTNGTETSAITSGMPNVLKTLLLCSLAFGCIFILAVVGVLGKLVFDSYRKRHYSRLDYLINGMY